jgi:cyanophycinase
MKWTNAAALSLCAMILSGSVLAQTPRGHLVIIGGGNRGPEVMNTFVRLAGGERSRIVVLPMASGLAASAGPEQIAFLKKHGAGQVEYMNLSREQADADSVVRLFDGVTGVFFSGGVQSRLTAALKGTRLERKLHELYRDGAVIGGTSAGAAVMSALMITGDERLNTDTANAYASIRAGNVVTTEGLGFVGDAIVDQHFIRRKRHNRLLSLVLEHPKLIGIGIDEATAIVWNPDRTFDVVGEATVLVLDASDAKDITSDKNGNLAAADLRLHLLKSGDRFDLAARKVLRR